jgi:hypothetical protein
MLRAQGITAISSLRQPCREAQRPMSMSTMSAANNPVGMPATRAHLTATAVRSLPVPATGLIWVCIVARTPVRSGIFSPDQCLGQPWYNNTE